MKIKIFKDENYARLENTANEFLTKNSLAENIKDIQITSSTRSRAGVVEYIIMVVM